MLTMLALTITAVPVFASESSLIKVGLKYGSAAKDTYTLTCNEGFYVGRSTGSDFAEVEDLTAYDTLLVSADGDAIVLRDTNGTEIFADLADYVVLPEDYDDGGTILIDGSAYRGGFCFTENQAGTLNSINILNVEYYLYGVLNGEMHHAHPLEALKAQAVAARSFALTNYNTHSEYGFDVCSGTHCQAYKGYSDEYKETCTAVDETAGLAIYAGGKVVPGYYFKNSGGHTQDSIDVWGGKFSYLTGVEDKYSPSYPWSVSFTFAELEQKLTAAKKSVGTLKKVAISERNSAGAAAELTFTGDVGAATLTKESVRTFFGAGLVKSTMFSFGDAEISPDDTDSGDDQGAVFMYNGNTKKTLPEKIYAIGSGNKTVQIKGNDSYAGNGTAAVKLSAVASGGNTGTSAASSASALETVTAGPLVINGLGYGHGVGMPQDSAIEMAKQGFTFDEILQYYYTGIEIR